MKYVWAFSIVFFLNLLIFSLIYIFLPQCRPFLTEEDQYIENISAIFFLYSFLFGLFYLPGLRVKPGFKLLIFISIMGLMGFLEELSFGESRFDLSMPVLYGVKIDAMHDFFFLGYKLIMKNVNISGSLILFLVAGGLILLLVIMFRCRHTLLNVASAVKEYPPYLLVLFFGMLILAALIIDLEFFQNEIWYLFEELFEMNAALALIFSILGININTSINRLELRKI